MSGSKQMSLPRNINRLPRRRKLKLKTLNIYASNALACVRLGNGDHFP